MVDVPVGFQQARVVLAKVEAVECRPQEANRVEIDYSIECIEPIGG